MFTRRYDTWAEIKKFSKLYNEENSSPYHSQLLKMIHELKPTFLFTAEEYALSFGSTLENRGI